MKIRSLTVCQFKKFDEPYKLDGLAGGINVVVGPNEMGKSTLLSALRAAFFEKYMSKSKHIVSLQNNRYPSAPAVCVEFELADGAYELKKRFLKKPYASLRLPGGDVLEGDAAEDRIQQLLNLGESSKSRSSLDSQGVWNLFWVQQGESFERIDPTDEAGSSLYGALVSEIARILGGRQAQTLIGIFENQRSEFVTPKTGKPTGTLKQLIERSAQLKGQLLELRDRQEELSNSMAELEAAQVTLDALRVETDLSRVRDELSDAREERSKVEVEATKVRSEVERLGERIEKIKKLKQQIEEVTNLVESHEKSIVIDGEELSQQEQRFNELDSKLKRIESECSKLETHLKSLERHQAAFELCTEIEKFSSIQQNIRELEEKASEIHVTEQLMREVEEANRRLSIADAKIKTNAASVIFELEEGGAEGVTINGIELEDNHHEVKVAEKLSIGIPQRGTIVVQPPEDLLPEREAAKLEMERLLESCKAKSVEHVNTLYKERSELIQSATLAQRELEVLLKNSGPNWNDARPVEEQISKNQKKLADEMSKLGIQDSAELRDQQSTIAEIRKESEEKSDKIANLQKAVEQLRFKINEFNLNLAKEEVGLKNSKKRLDELKKELAVVLGGKTTDELQAQFREKSAHIETLESELSELQRKIGEFELRIRQFEDKKSELEKEIVRLTTIIEDRQGVGLEEQIQSVERKLGFAKSDIEKCWAEVAELDLLLQTIQDSEGEVKNRFLSDILLRVYPYLRQIFPSATLITQEDGNVTDIERDPGGRETFQTLSIGTQEQISVLSRIAFAEFLVEKNHPAVIVLDDALVFSDDARIETMFRILSQASENIQILVFTCRAKLFENLGGNIVTIVPADHRTFDFA